MVANIVVTKENLGGQTLPGENRTGAALGQREILRP
jgi:hypothetical protein